MSAVTAAPVGNVALGAAAVFAESGVYMITLFNVMTGSPLCILGSHYKYVY